MFFFAILLSVFFPDVYEDDPCASASEWMDTGIGEVADDIVAKG